MIFPPLLYFEWVQSALATPDECVVMLHGILGQKRNLLGLARQFGSTFPNYRVLLIDLRNHGGSQGFKGPHTLEACASDLRQLFASMGVTPRSIIGHSFGAGVALTFARLYGESLKSIWLLDAVPSLSRTQPRTNDQQMEQIFAALEACSPCNSKNEFTACLEKRGLPRTISSWLAMNLYPEGMQLIFKPEPHIAREMLDDLRRNYVVSDFGHKNSSTRIFLIQAQRNLQWLGPIADKIAELGREGKLQALCLPHAGHWVHIDNPKGVLDMMAGDFA